MTKRLRPWPVRRLLLAAAAALGLGAAALLPPGAAVAAPAAGNAAVAPATASSTPFAELQMNLCNSGYASCYTGGRSVPEAASLIKSVRPDVVTLNEICSQNVPTQLQPALAAAWPGDHVFSAFYPAYDERTGAPYLCTNGDQYGNAVIGRVPAASWQGVQTWGGVYSTQDSGAESRSYSCAYAVGDYLACTTHLSAASKSVAFAQCQTLMSTVIPSIQSSLGITGSRTVVGGDFNLHYDTSDTYNVQKCVPAGYTRKGDGDVQHVIYSNDATFSSSSKYTLLYTDHPGWLVRLTRP
jgi:endonuclease/exonuclease/phosphatase family metal-dependent hydrolase